MSEIPLNLWHPIVDEIDLAHLGKLAEELNEAGAAVARCIIQGIAESEPVTCKPNKEWLEDELADVFSAASHVIAHFGLDQEHIEQRCAAKQNLLGHWHKSLGAR